MKKIVITEFMDEIGVKFLSEKGFELLHDKTLARDQERLIGLIADYHGIIVRNVTQINEALLNAAKHLQVVGRLGVGLDNIDTIACKKQGITVIPAIGANANAVLEYVLLAALSMTRPIMGISEEILNGTWEREKWMLGEIGDCELGLVGFGQIAQLIAEKSRQLFKTVRAYDPLLPASHPAWHNTNTKRLATLEELLKCSDIVSIHVPLLPETKHLIDKQTLQLMKPNAILINTSRGGIVDERALAEALQEQSIKGAIIDVFAEEPVATTTQKIFQNTPNLILTPHIAGVTQTSNVRIGRMIAEKVSATLLST